MRKLLADVGMSYRTMKQIFYQDIYETAVNQEMVEHDFNNCRNACEAHFHIS